MFKQWIPRISLLAFSLLFLTGCYTQVGNVKKTTQRDYEPPRDEIVYEDEYYQENDTVYVETEEQLPTYQYNFYNDPYDYNMYYSPYYSSFSSHWGYDPWFYDPWYFDPYSSYRFRANWNPYRSWGNYGLGWGGYYGYGGGYFGYSSAYYGSYDPYWGYYSSGYYGGGFVSVKPQNRRDFGHRRGLATGSGSSHTIPHMATVASRNKNSSRVERIRKSSTTVGNKGRALTTSSTNRTRKTTDNSIRVVSKKPVRKLSSQGRISRTPTKVRTSTSTRAPSNRSSISNTSRRTTKSNPSVSSKRRTTKSVPSVSSRGSSSRTKSKAAPTRVKRSKSSKSYTPSSSRSRSSTTRSSGSSYRPRTSSSGSSATRSTSGRSSSSGSKSGSSSRTKKK